MVREAIFLILFSILSMVMGEGEIDDNRTTTLQPDSAASSLSGLWALSLTMTTRIILV